MNPQKVGELIKKIRKDNKLTQRALADKYGVTYQAVSKWENGTNLPDIILIKQMCDDFNLDVNNFLDGESVITKPKKNNSNMILITIIVVLLIIIIGIVLFILKNKKEEPIEFKNINTTCDTFKVSGHIAYDASKSAIHVNNITYCGGDDTSVYDSITCILYENDNTIYTCETKNNITLENYLKELSIKVNNYKQTCKIYKEDTLILTINATLNHKDVTYNIPLHLDDDC